jgi:hypothetical protein
MLCNPIEAASVKATILDISQKIKTFQSRKNNNKNEKNPHQV